LLAVKLRKPSPPHWDRRIAHARCSGDSLPPSPPTEKATACEDQTGQSSTSDGTGNSGRIGYEILLDLRNRATASGGCGNKQAHSN
jgi:hypothetical protein